MRRKRPLVRWRLSRRWREPPLTRRRAPRIRRSRRYPPIRRGQRVHPLHTECVELADVGGLLAPRPPRGDARQIGRQAMQVIDQRDLLRPPLSEAAGVLHREEDLPAAHSASHLNVLQ